MGYGYELWVMGYGLFTLVPKLLLENALIRQALAWPPHI